MKSIPASIYWRNDNPLHHQGIRIQFGASIIQNLYFADFFLVRSVSPNYARMFGASIYWRSDKRDVPVLCVFPIRYKLPSFWPIQTGIGNILFQQKRQVQISNRPPSSGPQTITQPSPSCWSPPFSLYTTFNVTFTSHLLQHRSFFKPLIRVDLNRISEFRLKASKGID
jgi:hypothetical protein